MKTPFLSLAVIFSLVCPMFSWATPPSEMTLEYDLSSKMLHIKIIHVTSNVRDHHIRKIDVSKNGESVNVIRLASQTNSSEILQDVSLDAKQGDIISVKAYCSEAGTKEESITIASSADAADTTSSSIEPPSGSPQVPAETPKPKNSNY